MGPTRANPRLAPHALRVRADVRARTQDPRWLARGPSRSLRATRRRPAASRAGLTLIEIMMVVVIIGIGASAVSVGIGAVTKTNLRSACIRLVALSQYAYHRALANGTTVRMTLDLDEGSVMLSEAEGRVSLVRSDAPLREKAAEDEDIGDPGAALDPWESLRTKLEKPLEELKFPPSPFSSITSNNGTPIKRFQKQPVGDDIRIVRVIVAHEAEPREAGKTDLFFFPSGLTQHAVVQLRDKGDSVFSVEIHPLTGRGTVHNTPFEPEVLVDDPTRRDSDATELRDGL
jgi:prepilin-type N-terminal cleavage/methylation domain-containing protein